MFRDFPHLKNSLTAVDPDRINRDFTVALEGPADGLRARVRGFLHGDGLTYAHVSSFRAAGSSYARRLRDPDERWDVAGEIALSVRDLLERHLEEGKLAGPDNVVQSFTSWVDRLVVGSYRDRYRPHIPRPIQRLGELAVSIYWHIEIMNQGVDEVILWVERERPGQVSFVRSRVLPEIDRLHEKPGAGLRPEQVTNAKAASSFGADDDMELSGEEIAFGRRPSLTGGSSRTPEQELLDKCRREYLERQVHALPEPQRTLIRERYLNGTVSTIREFNARHGTTSGSYHNRQALDRIRSAMEDWEDTA